MEAYRCKECGRRWYTAVKPIDPKRDPQHSGPRCRCGGQLEHIGPADAGQETGATGGDYEETLG